MTYNVLSGTINLAQSQSYVPSGTQNPTNSTLFILLERMYNIRAISHWREYLRQCEIALTPANGWASDGESRA